MKQRTIVLLGIGHTNAHVIKQWRSHPIKNCQLICISRFPTATYSGMLPAALGLQLDPQAMRIDLKALCDRSGAKLVLADTSGLDRANGRILFHDHQAISFDALSIGVGSLPQGWDQHPGAESLVAIKPMQTFLHRLRDRLRACRQQRDRSRCTSADAGQHPTSQSTADPTTRAIHIAVVGGGVASVEVALCLRRLCNRQDANDPVSISIYTSSDTLARGLRRRSVNQITRMLRARNIQVRYQHRVTRVGDGVMETDDGRQHAADVVVWVTGAAPPPVLGRLGLQSDGRGFIATTDTLQSLSDPRIFAVGDCGTIVDNPAPKAGVYAVRQCPILWHNLQAFLAGDFMKTFKPQSDFLKLLNTGDGKALMQYGFLSAHARWCWWLKTWIDQRFVSEFRQVP